MKSLFMKVSLMFLLTALFLAGKGIPVNAETHSYDGKSPYYNDCDSSGSTKKSSNLVNANK
ncbi:YjfA [Bacillus atrophaeus UCMB-5137]|nr:YjfA [Bacillus atrophaeus UCMB-5137]